MAETKKNIQLKELEDDVISAFDDFKSDNNKKTSTVLFINLKKLTSAAIIANRWHTIKKDLNVEHISYECSVFLFEKILNGTFKPEATTCKKLKEGQSNRFPWYKYISLALKKFVYSDTESMFSTSLFIDIDAYSHLMYDDAEYNAYFKLEEMFDDEKQDKINIEKRLNTKMISKKISESLKMFYSKEEIKRLYPIAVDYIVENKIKFAEDDIREFCYVLICLAKRIVNNNNMVSINNDAIVKNLKLDNIINSAIKSSVFIAAILNNSKLFPKELLLALDIESLYRLSTIKGGETIRIPTLLELETLIGATVIASERLISGTSEQRSRWKIKKDYEISFKNNLNLDNVVNNILYSVVNFQDTSSTPMVNTLLSSIQAIEKQSQYINSNVDKLKGEELVNCFIELNDSLSMLTNSFICLNKIIKTNMNNDNINQSVNII
jgi:hypothetical protein